MLRLLLAAPLALVALPAIAKDRARTPHDVSAAIAKGCRAQHVDTPAGKMVHNATIIDCPRRHRGCRRHPESTQDRALTLIE